MGKGFDYFMLKPYWKKIYENAPTLLLKGYYRLAFDNSPLVLGKDYDSEKYNAEIWLMQILYGGFTSRDVKYLYDNTFGTKKSYYKKWLEELAEKEKIEKTLEAFLEDSDRKKYYDEAPTENCKEYIYLQYCGYIDYYDEEITERIKNIRENKLVVKDFEYLQRKCRDEKMKHRYQEMINKAKEQGRV